MEVCLHYNALIILYDLCSSRNVMPIQKDRNCLFRAVSYCMYNTEDRHSEITPSTDNKITNE